MTILEQYARRADRVSDISGHLDFIFRQAKGRLAMAELGVREGNSTCALLAAIEVSGAGHLWSVDIAPAKTPPAWQELPYWHFLHADDLSPAARQHIPARIDLLFIDTSHGEDHTLAELAAYGPRVMTGGIILAHDTCWSPGDIELHSPTGPVARALDTWCRLRKLEWENRAGSYGLGVIWL